MHGAGFVTEATPDGVRLRLADDGHAAGAVRVWCETPLPASVLEAVPGGWELHLRDLPVDRLEYLFDVDGRLGLDPGNPRVVPGAFGDHSWLPLTGYREPAWLAGPRVEGTHEPYTVPTPAGDVDLLLWRPADDDPAAVRPLLAVHDGPEMAAYGRVTDFVAAQVAAGALPPCRVALLAPGPRDQRYGADPGYADALVDHVLPYLAHLAPSGRPPVLMGQSLGGLAALFAAWRRPGHLDGLFLQSGSFFTPDLDPQEAGYARFPEITAFTAAVHDPGTEVPALPPVTLTCGTAEENLANNRLMRARLASTGTDVDWGEIRDGHTWTCWRDLLDPFLTRLLVRRWA